MSNLGNSPRFVDSSKASARSDAVVWVRIGHDADGQRLDNYLLRIAKGVPKSHIYRIVRAGEVRINKKRVTVDTRLALGDELRVPPIRVATQPKPARVKPIDDQDLPILYEDEHLIVVDKPAGLAAHGGSGVSFGLIERVRASRPNQPYLELAHRLDRETSGVMILAKTRKALVRLHEMMRDGEVHKSYRTLVLGDWVNDRQHVKVPLFKYVTSSGERRVRVDEEKGLPSHTIFQLIERFGDVSYLSVDLKTGRTHQIRVHAQYCGHPLVGDEKYGNFEMNKAIAKGCLGIPFKRMFLHAAHLSFKHPVTGAPMEISAPLPRECDELITTLRARKER
ncbi:MAG TPA: RluA family pseudouridine synthase [Candidatus Aphodousia faecipullorum]|nr:RluA family pseudouridine synthase [Candidatus Aphodousia faecipullorum]